MEGNVEALTNAFFNDAEVSYDPGVSDGLYRKAVIPKKNGGSRVLYIPCDELKQDQWNILNSLQANKAISAFPFPCNGFRKYKSIRDNAYPHLKAAVLLNCDLKDFFRSINSAMVRDACIKTDLLDPDTIDYIVSKCTYENHIPQGAPTSPFLSNMVMRDFDLYMMRICRTLNVSYSRYADDFSLSTSYDDDGRSVKLAYYAAHKAVTAMGLAFNYRKFRIQKRHQRMEVTGVVINDKLNAPRRRRKEVRAGLYNILKRLEAGESISSVYMEYDSLRGYITFSEFVRHENETPSTKNIITKIENIISSTRRTNV